jgi:hypothetical protein
VRLLNKGFDRPWTQANVEIERHATEEMQIGFFATWLNFFLWAARASARIESGPLRTICPDQWSTVAFF